MNDTYPRLRAKAVLFDVDNTVVMTRPELPGDVFETVLCEQAAQLTGASVQVVRKQLCSDGADHRVNVQAQLDRLGLKTERYVLALCEAMKPWVQAFDDAARVIPQLCRRGYRLYPATTNGRVACLAKFTLAGLAWADSSPFFCDLFGGDEVHPEGKTTPQFYVELMHRIALKPDEVVMVGDDPHHDLALAWAADIRQIVLPRREQTESVTFEPDGGIYVRSLDSLLDMLPPLNNPSVKGRSGVS